MNNPEFSERPAFPTWLVALILLLTLTAVTGLTALAQPLQPQIQIQTPIGTVNDQVITLEQFETEVRFENFRSATLPSAGAQMDRPLLLNRIVLEAIVLQAADEAGVSVTGAELDAEMGGILSEFGISQAQMTEQLAEHSLSWGDFQASVERFLLIRRYINDVLLVDIPLEQQGLFLQLWATEQVSMADISFDPTFLESIGAVGPNSALGTDN